MAFNPFSVAVKWQFNFDCFCKRCDDAKNIDIGGPMKPYTKDYYCRECKSNKCAHAFDHSKQCDGKRGEVEGKA